MDKNGAKFLSMDNVHQNKKEVKEEEERHHIRDSNLVNDKLDHPMDFIVMTFKRTSWIIKIQINCPNDSHKRSSH